VQPLSPPQSNEVVEMAAVGVKKLKQFGGESAPESMQFVVVDLRGRSLFMIDADATAFDSRARPGQKIKVGTVADWADSRNYIQLVVDGRYAYPPHRATELPETPRFLPDVLTGGAVAFLAPAQHESLELRCDFPNARTPSGVLRPKGLTLGVEGRRPAAPKVSPIATIDDKELLVTIAGQSMAASFAGKPAEDGFAFFVVDVVVHNRGKNGEHFQTPEMVKYVTARGQQVTIDPVSFEGPYRPTELIWIPAGEVRAFQAVYKVPANERKPRLAYRGFNTAEVVFLKPMDELAQ
jgi:hypothetical protein